MFVNFLNSWWTSSRLICEILPPVWFIPTCYNFSSRLIAFDVCFYHTLYHVLEACCLWHVNSDVFSTTIYCDFVLACTNGKDKKRSGLEKLSVNASYDYIYPTRVTHPTEWYNAINLICDVTAVNYLKIKSTRHKCTFSVIKTAM